MHGQQRDRSRGELAYRQGQTGDTIQFLGGASSSDPRDGEIISLRHLDHPEWVVTFVFGPDGVAALVIKPYVPVPPSNPLTEFDEVTRRWSRAQVGPIPDESPPITARLLRKLPIGELESWARGWLRSSSATKASLPMGGHLREWFGDDSRAQGKRGRKHSDHAYAQLAAAYVANVDRGGSLRDLATAEGWSESTVRNRLTDARQRGLLTAPPRGRAGGELTEKALRLLQEEG